MNLNSTKLIKSEKITFSIQPNESTFYTKVNDFCFKIPENAKNIRFQVKTANSSIEGGIIGYGDQSINIFGVKNKIVFDSNKDKPQFTSIDRISYDVFGQVFIFLVHKSYIKRDFELICEFYS